MRQGSALIRACWRVAWANLTARATRSLVAALGIAFSIFLMALQLGFLDAARRASTEIFSYFDFDLALVAREYQFLYSVPSFDRIRLTQLAAAAEVADTFRLDIDRSYWLDPRTERRSSLLLIGIEAKPAFLAAPALRRGLAALDDYRRILIDAYSHADYGALGVGTVGQIGEREVTVAGQFALGAFFYAEGSAVALDNAFQRLTGRGSRELSFGLVKLKPGADPAAVARSLGASLPDDVTVLTKAELIRQEQDYFVRTKPIGIMFHAGVLIALAVGIVVLFQVLSTEINNRMREYATFKAIGFGSRFVNGVGVVLTGLFALLGFLPAVVVSRYTFAEVRRLSHLPMQLTPALLATVLALTLAMAFASGLVTLHRLRRADPAELF